MNTHDRCPGCKKGKKYQIGYAGYFMHGFQSSDQPEKSNALGIQGVVMKPVVISEIAETIRNVMDNPDKEK